MSKPKYITIKNYRQFKPSEFVRSFISDIEVAEEIGKPMNMAHFRASSDCLPCLGGMACMNLGYKVPMYPNVKKVLTAIAFLGDHIRKGDGIWVREFIKNLYPNTCIPSLPSFKAIHGLAWAAELKSLKQRINKYADIIEASGQ